MAWRGVEKEEASTEGAKGKDIGEENLLLFFLRYLLPMLWFTYAEQLMRDICLQVTQLTW